MKVVYFDTGSESLDSLDSPRDSNTAHSDIPSDVKAVQNLIFPHLSGAFRDIMQKTMAGRERGMVAGKKK